MIQLKNVEKKYQMGPETLRVLKGIDLVIEDGEFVAIMGPSGSGKSTLMNILGLLDTPSEGSYILNKQLISGLAEDDLSEIRRNEIGFVFQQFHLLPRMNALENVLMPTIYSQTPNAMLKANELLESVKLTDRSQHQPKELSGGQQQRIAIARSLINSPQIILADEPTGNLDSASEVEIMKILKQLNEQGITVILVTHEEEIGNQARRLIRMRDGLIQSDVRKENASHMQKTNKTSMKKQPHRKTLSFDFFNYFMQGLKTLLANKLRSALSMLGILIGVAAVISMLALGKGAQAAIEEQLSSLGSNLLLIRPGAARVGGVSQDSGIANRLLYDDIRALQNKVPEIQRIAGNVSGRGQVTAFGKNWNTIVTATSSSWADMKSLQPTLGRFFIDQENTQRARVAVIGETVRKELFQENQTVVGEMIKINRVNFQIIGVLPEKGSNGWQDQDDRIVIPLLTGMHRLFGRTNIEAIEAEIDSQENMENAQDKIKQILFLEKKIPLSQQDDAFTIRNMADIQQALQSSSKTMSLLLSAIAAISLLVGGIGIMNIMLVSVTERTKEIGLRKAVGAKRNDILIQFLSESAVISVVGGICGIILGWIITIALSQLAGWTTMVSISSVLLATIFSIVIGIIFGVYPARKASKLNPIDALRYE